MTTLYGLLFLAFSICATEMLSLNNRVRQFIDANMPLNQQNIKAFTSSVKEFSPDDKKEAMGCLLYLWSKNMKQLPPQLFRCHYGFIREIIPVGDYLVVDSNMMKRGLCKFIDGLYQPIDTQSFSEQLEKAECFSCNDRYFLMNCRNAGQVFVYDFKTQMLKTYGQSDDLEICYMKHSQGKKNLFYVIRKGKEGKGLYLEYLDLNKPENDNNTISLAERFMVENPYFSDLTTREFDCHGPVQCVSNKNYVMASDGKSLFGITLEDIDRTRKRCPSVWGIWKCMDLLAAGSNRELAMKRADRNEIIMYEGRREKSLLGNLDGMVFKYITFVDLPANSKDEQYNSILAVVIRGKSRDFLGFYKGTMPVVYELPFDVTKMWSCQGTLFVQSGENLIDYPAWFLSDILTLQPYA